MAFRQTGKLVSVGSGRGGVELGLVLVLDSNSDWGSDPDSDSDSDSDWASASEDGDDDDAEDSIEVPAGLVIVGLSVVESADDAGVLAGAVASTEPSFAEAEVAADTVQSAQHDRLDSCGG